MLTIETHIKLVARKIHPKNTVIKIGKIEIGGGDIVVMAGPCAVESEKQLLQIAFAVKKAGAKFLRGGAFKPRTSPYSFQGLGEQGLKLLQEAKDVTGLKIVTEVMDVRQISLVSKYADILQIGSRNMQNFPLLKELGQVTKPVLLKRGMGSTISEFLLSAEYVMKAGNKNVILCERGIRTFENSVRASLDITAVPLLKELTHLPVIVDPSHAAGKASLVGPMCQAVLAAGADGLLVEVHHDPGQAFSDGSQSLELDAFALTMKRLKKLAKAFGRKC